MKRTLLLLILFLVGIWYFVLYQRYQAHNDLNLSEMNKNFSYNDYLNYLGNDKSDNVTYDPPMHPSAYEKLAKINRSSLGLEDLEWVTYSEVKPVQWENELGFDFEFPQNYYVLDGYVSELTVSGNGECIKLVGKEEKMFILCSISGKYQSRSLLNEFQEDSENADFKGIPSLVRLSYIWSLPKQEMLIPMYDKDRNVTSAYLFIYPLQNVENYTPEDPDFWNEVKDFYTRLEIPISKRILNSIELNL